MFPATPETTANKTAANTASTFITTSIMSVFIANRYFLYPCSNHTSRNSALMLSIFSLFAISIFFLLILIGCHSTKKLFMQKLFDATEYDIVLYYTFLSKPGMKWNFFLFAIHFFIIITLISLIF